MNECLFLIFPHEHNEAEKLQKSQQFSISREIAGTAKSNHGDSERNKIYGFEDDETFENVIKFDSLFL